MEDEGGSGYVDVVSNRQQYNGCRLSSSPGDMKPKEVHFYNAWAPRDPVRRFAGLLQVPGQNITA